MSRFLQLLCIDSTFKPYTAVKALQLAVHNQTEKNLHCAKHSVKWSDGKAGLERALNEAALPQSVQTNAKLELQSSLHFLQVKLCITVSDTKLPFFFFQVAIKRDFPVDTFLRSVVLFSK